MGLKRHSVIVCLLALIGQARASCGVTYPYISGAWYSGALGTQPNGACSGNGVCNATTGLCTCNEGWTGLSDLVNTEGIDCQINEWVIKGEWMVVVILPTLLVARSLPKLKTKIERHRITKKRRLAQGKSYSMRKNDPTLVAAYFYTLGCYPSMAALGLLRIFKEDERAGLTFGYTFLMCTAKFAFYTAVFFYQPAVLKSLLSGSKGDSKQIARQVKLANLTQAVTLVLSCVAAILPFFTFFNDEKGISIFAQEVYISYFIFQIVSILILFVSTSFARVQNRKIFAQSFALTKDERINILRNLIDSAETKAIFSCVLVGNLYLAFIIFPILWNRHDYILPLTWIPFIILGHEINTQVVVVRPTRSGSKEATSLPSPKSFARAFSSFRKGSKDSKDDSKNDSLTLSPMPSSNKESSQFAVSAPKYDDGYV